MSQDAVSEVDGLVGDDSAARDVVSIDGTRSAAGWLIFVAVVCIVYELIAVLQRFININVVSSNITLFILIVS